MKITRFGFGRLRCALVFGLCLSLILSTFLPSALSMGTAKKTGWAGAHAPEKGNDKKVSPVAPRTGPPAVNLPNLDQIRHAQTAPVRAVEPIPSTMRSRHSPLEPREGRSVSDRLPGRRRSHHVRHTSRRALSAMAATMPLTLTFSDDPLTSGVVIKAIHITELRDAIDQARSRAGLVVGSWTEAVATGVPVRASHITEMRSKLDEARAVLGYSIGGYTDPSLGAGYWVKATHLQELREHVREVLDVTSSDQYVANFLQWGLGRSPTGPESTYWKDIIRTAYPHGLSSMQLAMRELGMTVFESAEYASRSRNDHWYVYDLYKTFLMRDPDAEGWANWEAAVPNYGREQVRRAFDESTEFANIVAALNASGSPSAAVSSLATARVDPFNQSGNQLQARDAEWGISLISLPGRAGLDLGLGLSYSSLVWTNSGPYLYFDADNASLSPGFHIGFPTIQDKFFDARVGKNVYLLTTAAGRRVELRQVGTSNVYESADSSYLQLTYNGNLLLRTTDGTSMTYSWTGINEYRCTLIQDRNGNYILVNYDWRGHLQNVTDTLSRVITFNYDTNENLNSITQSWNGQSHTWASFGWGNLTMQPTVTGVVGTYGGEEMPVLNMVAYHDGTYTKFLYNGNGQVERITQYASDSNPATDNHPRNYTAFDYDSPTSDCPRLNAMHVWAEYWTGLNGVPNEVTTQFGVEGDKHTIRVVGDPNGTIYKQTYAGSADASWMRGLVKSSEVWAGGLQQKNSTTTWTQADTNLNYKDNPRVIETNVYDSAGNRRRTTADYSVALYAQYGLPYIVREYAADATTILRETYTDYKLDQPYLDRRIIGLVAAVHLVSNGYQGKVTYGYDDPARLSSQATTAMMHDQNYNGTFTIRGNVTDVSRWDVTDMNTIVDPQKALTTFMNYNAAGSVVAVTDPATHTNQISYADSFSDGNNGRNTLAYPTMLTDGDNFSSSVQYNFDFGAKTRSESPPPENQSNGLIQTFTYDSAARLQRATALNNGGYTHYEYGPFWVKSYASVNTVAANYSESDLYSIQVFDGLGRVFGTVANHPGSVGGYRLVNTIFDLMGQAWQQSNPTEIDNSWVPAGDDAYNAMTGEGGMRYTLQTFDWQGRPLRTTHPDSTYKEVSYSVCGCAGSELTTLTDEVGRRQKLYSDGLGRRWKTEILNWDGSVYATTTTSFNARDQVTLIRQFAGTDQSSTYQDTITSFDGYGRLKSRHVPEQNANTATNWEYNSDNTLHKVTDARGASATYTYNNHRRLLTLIEYTAPSGITSTTNAEFTYDGAGNRTSMTDALGTKTYQYDQLSRLTSESRNFNGLGPFSLSYQYNVAGELTKVTDATNTSINYTFDSAGRTASVTGSDNLFAGVSNYVSNVQYRAWGGLKSMTDGTGHVSSLSYNRKLLATQFDISGNVVHQNFDYFDDGRLSFVHNTTDQNFDRSYSYDHVGRLTENKTGGQARGDSGTSPYYESFGYDAFSNLNSRGSETWNGFTSDFDAATYTNGRRDGWGYDADGRNKTIDTRTYTYNSAGQQILMTGQRMTPLGHYINVSQGSGYDGDGAKVSEVSSGITTYYLRSSVLNGAVVQEINGNGEKTVGYVYLGGQVTAVQLHSSSDQVIWKHNSRTSLYETYSNTTFVNRKEFDAMGADVQLEQPPEPPPPQGDGDIGGNGGYLMDRFANFFNLGGGCVGSISSAACSQVMTAQQYLDAQTRAFFGYSWYDLPGNANEAAQGEERYLSLIQTGYDPAFRHFWGTYSLTVNGTAVQTIKNPTLDQMAALTQLAGAYQAMFDFLAGIANGAGGANGSAESAGASSGSIQTAYGPDSGSVDYNTNTVTIYGGAEYFVGSQGATEQPLTKGQADIVWNVKESALLKLLLYKDCKDYIGAGAFDKLVELWNSKQIKYFHGTQFSASESDGTIAAARGGVWSNGILSGGPYSWDSTKRIVLGYLFFQPNVGGITHDFNLSTEQAMAFVMLHELKHVLSQTGHPNPDPGNDPNSSAVWNQNIYDKCFKNK